MDSQIVNWILALFYAGDWIIRITMIIVVPRNRKPASATAWLVLILFLPYIGLLVYLLLGNPKLPLKRRIKQRAMNKLICNAINDLKSNLSVSGLLDIDVEKRYKPFVELNKNLGGMPAFSGNQIKLLPRYDQAIESIAKDISQAKKYVHIEYYALAIDKTTKPVLKAIEGAVKKGIKVRVLFDTIGSKNYPGYKQMKQNLTDMGVEWHNSLPLRLPGSNFTRPDLRNHRKIVVIDGYIGYTGSQNLIQRNYHRKDKLYYDELVIRAKGPITLQLNAAFITDWYSETSILLERSVNQELDSEPKPFGSVVAQILPSGPGFDNDNNLKLFVALIHAANSKVVITNPYFVPDGALMNAITSAVQRGVDVSLINSHIMDQAFVGHAQHSFYEELLQTGVKIYWYHNPVLLHSKHMTIDNDIATIGSSNFDMRSFQLDLEVTMVVYNKSVVSDLRKIETEYIGKSKLITYEKWKKRPFKTIIFENIARLTSAVQ